MVHALFYYAKVGNSIGILYGILVLAQVFCWGSVFATHSVVLYVWPSKLRISYLSRWLGWLGWLGKTRPSCGCSSCFSSYVPGWCIVIITYLLGQWLNFTAFLELHILVGKMKFKLLFQGPLAKWAYYYYYCYCHPSFHSSSPRVENGSRWSRHINEPTYNIRFGEPHSNYKWQDYGRGFL